MKEQVRTGRSRDRVDVLREHSRWEEVKILLEKRLVEDPTGAKTAFKLACILLITDGAQAALVPARTSMKFSPESLETHLLLEKIYREMGQESFADKSHKHCLLLSHGEADKLQKGQALIKKWSPPGPDALKKKGKKPRNQAASKSKAILGSQQQNSSRRAVLLAGMGLSLAAALLYVNQPTTAPQRVDLSVFQGVMKLEQGYWLDKQKAMILQVSSEIWDEYSEEQQRSAMSELLRLAREQGAVAIQLQDKQTHMLAVAQAGRISIRTRP